MTPDQTTAYLQRIGIDQALDPTLANLALLQSQHLISVPFENVDVLLGNEIVLDEDALFDKIVARRRGGYCFEANGLFRHLLRALGYKVDPAMARVWYRNAPGEVHALTHIVNVVTIDRTAYIVDVGFGGQTPRIPLPLRQGAHQDTDGIISLREVKTHGWMYARETDEGRLDQFSVTGEPAFRADWEMANYFVSHSPSSLFTQALRISLFTPVGRITLNERAYSVRAGTDSETQRIQDATEVFRLLQDVFGLRIGEKHEELIQKI